MEDATAAAHSTNLISFQLALPNGRADEIELLTGDAALMGMELVGFALLNCGGLWAGTAANAPHNERQAKPKPTECLFINHTTPFLFFSSFTKRRNEKEIESCGLLAAFDLMSLLFALLVFSWVMVGGPAPRQLAQREDERRETNSK